MFAFLLAQIAKVKAAVASLVTNVDKAGTFAITGANENVTISNDTYGFSSYDTATITLHISSSSVATGWNAYATIPTEYVPVEGIYFALFDFNGTALPPRLAYVNPNGKIEVRDPVEGHNYYGSITYVRKTYG